MRLPKFRYMEPKSIKEASTILLDEPGAKILAGGTDILPNMKHKVELPSVVVNIKKIPELDFIRKDNGVTRIGPLTSLKKIYQNESVKAGLPALASAASSVGSYHHQNMGTIGGNICQQNRCKYFNQSQWWRSARPLCVKAGGEICHVVNREEICYSAYSGDMAPALLALNARIILESKEDSREIPLETFFSGDGKAPLNFKRGEILTEIIVPEGSSGGFSSYSKFANRESIDFPIVGTAFWASTGEKEYRVAFTAVDRRPLRGRDVENFLNGKDLSDEVREEAVSIASKAATPVKTSVYSPSYKRNIMGRLLRVAIDEVMRREG
ncbi:MAG: FAD binding domain-containing protein [Proteobacteria bacterium]|nr:FAD binding domain-containing protein [Desulfobacterales bacterium]MBL6967737.1 FAD binding domain-containing protein [Desulfobacteraceae bacterium]MBU0734312.1 FAD binding domain-containing protein [Pseudomonadota bacterium]MBL7102014.1 FAD binding domain-containing protein [Desulfobacteraceae bacterium]MBL7172661.1 FAD binding domain-containing protein [Desulfobacteraceae bacterium]